MSHSERIGHACSVRLAALDMQGLAAAERHGKRVDAKGQSRQVRDIDPVVYGGLNLHELFDAHASGVKRNAAMRKPVGHLLFQFPTGLPLANETNEKWLLDTAIEFSQRVYGGNAVFAGRVDRDEKNRHVVDVFIAPKYLKKTKEGETEWLSIGRWHKPLCEKHRAEIERRHNGRFNSGPRAQGMALQSELIAFLRDKGLDIDDKAEKNNPAPDRDEPEVYAAKRIAEAERKEERAERAANAVVKRLGRIAAKAAMVAVGKWQSKSPATQGSN